MRLLVVSSWDDEHRHQQGDRPRSSSSRRLGQAPYQYSTLVTLRIGTDGSYKGKDGRMVERVDWHNVACWGDVGEQAQGIRKGDVVQVEGQLRTRSYGEGDAKKWVT